VTKVMKVKVGNLQVLALSAERGANRSAIVREYAAEAFSCESALLVYERACVVAADIEEGYALIVSALSSWILAVPDEQHLRFGVEIGPFDPADLFLAHRRGDGESDNSTQRDLLARIGLERRDEAVQFVLGRAPVAFTALPDEPETRKSNAGEDDRLHGHDHAVDGGGVGEDRLDVAEVDRE
jgi:hypothetical protein